MDSFFAQQYRVSLVDHAGTKPIDTLSTAKSKKGNPKLEFSAHPIHLYVAGSLASLGP